MEEVKAYEFADRPLYTRSALEILEGKRGEIEQGLKTGRDSRRDVYEFFRAEADTLEEYLEELKPYNDILRQGYEDITEVPRPEVVLGRIEDDMDLMARERDLRLDETAPKGVSRRELFEKVFEDEVYDKPVLTDTWIMMNEAEKLREVF